MLFSDLIFSYLTRFGDPLPSKPNWYRTIGNPCKCQAKPPSYGTKSWTWQSHGVRSQDIEFPQKRSWALNRSSPGLQIEKSETKPSDYRPTPAKSSLITFLLLQPVLNFPVPTPWKFRDISRNFLTLIIILTTARRRNQKLETSWRRKY